MYALSIVLSIWWSEWNFFHISVIAAVLFCWCSWSILHSLDLSEIRLWDYPISCII